MIEPSSEWRSDLPCKIWPGNIQTDTGYGRVWLGRNTGKGQQQQLAHRWTWEQAHGPIPPGPPRLEVCHHCDNPPCVELEHLFLATHAENMADMRAKGRGGRGRTHCQNGHELTPENTERASSGFRMCRTCRSERKRTLGVASQSARRSAAKS